MSETDDTPPAGDVQVEMMNRINHLKRKAGGDPKGHGRGRIDEDAIKEADRQIEAFCSDCPRLVNEALEELIAAWEALKETQDDAEKDAYAKNIFTKAHQIKDIAGTCGYILISDFGAYLRDYILETKLDHDAHEQIVQAHIDAMSVAYKQDIKDDGGPVAMELRAALKKAIEKYN